MRRAVQGNPTRLGSLNIHRRSETFFGHHLGKWAKDHLMLPVCFRRHRKPQSPGEWPRLSDCLKMLYEVGTAGFEPATP